MKPKRQNLISQFYSFKLLQMCSDEEIKIRQELHQVSIFELERGQDINTKLAKINPEYAVK